MIAALVVASTLLSAPAYGQQPAWAVAVGRSFCSLRQSGMESREALRAALRHHLPTWLDEMLADGTRIAGMRIAVVIAEECPSLGADLLAGAGAGRGAAADALPQGPPQAKPRSNSQACSSFLLVEGRKQCL
jgi:hypothetical protein